MAKDANTAAPQPPENIRRMPVTLLSGFLGSGKTTLLEHILKSNEHGLKIAVIVNDMAKLNIDAALLQNHKVSVTKERLIQMQNGCICCTLRGDLLSELARLSKAKEIDYVVIESSGISEPMQVAETFTAEFSQAMLEAGEEMLIEEEDKKVLDDIVKLGGLHHVAMLDTVVTVVDGFNLLSNFDTDEFLSDRWGAQEIVVPEDERTISDLLVDQLEFADVIVVNKMDSIDQTTRERIKKIVKALNPNAKLLESSYCKIDVKEIINTGMFDFVKAASGSGWLKGLHDMTIMNVAGGQKITPKPETLEYGINNFVYTARRPFHPRKLFQLIHDKFIVLQSSANQAGNEDESEDGEEEDEMEGIENGDNNIDDDSQDQDTDIEVDTDGEESDGSQGQSPITGQPEPAIIMANRRSHPIFSHLLRSKGFIWLATRPLQYGEWSQAGAMLTVGCGGTWFVEVPREEWPEDPEVFAAVEKDFQEPWGDRRQEIVFIGEGIDVAELTRLLDECLLTDVQMKKWGDIFGDEEKPLVERVETLTRSWEDGWEDWPEIEIEEIDPEEEEKEEEDGDDGVDVNMGDKKKKKPKHRIRAPTDHDHSHFHGHDHSH